MKLLWSPVVDAAYSTKIGRRRTWVIPLQLLLAVTLYITSISFSFFFFSFFLF